MPPRNATIDSDCATYGCGQACEDGRWCGRPFSRGDISETTERPVSGDRIFSERHGQNPRRLDEPDLCGYADDLPGNVVEVLNAAIGGWEAWYAYDAFGNILKEGGAYKDKNPIRLDYPPSADSDVSPAVAGSVATKYTDEDAARERGDGAAAGGARRVEEPGAPCAATKQSGLIYSGFRFYDAKKGRLDSCSKIGFGEASVVNRDPIGDGARERADGPRICAGPKGGGEGTGVCRSQPPQTGGANLYRFVGNDPANQWDYLGMKNPNLKAHYEGGGFGMIELPAFEVFASRAEFRQLEFIKQAALEFLKKAQNAMYAERRARWASAGSGVPNGKDGADVADNTDDQETEVDPCHDLLKKWQDYLPGRKEYSSFANAAIAASLAIRLKPDNVLYKYSSMIFPSRSDGRKVVAFSYTEPGTQKKRTRFIILLERKLIGYIKPVSKLSLGTVLCWRCWVSCIITFLLVAIGFR